MRRRHSAAIACRIPLFGEAIARLLSDLGVHVVHRSIALNTALRCLKTVAPRFVVLERDTLGLDVAGPIRAVRGLLPQARIVLLCASADGLGMHLSEETGVDHCVCGCASTSRLRNAFRRVFAEGNGEAQLEKHPPPPGRQRCKGCGDVTPKVLACLTKREADVLPHLARGFSIKETAARLGLGTKTIDTHKLHLMTKLGVPNSVMLTRLAIREGIIPIWETPVACTTKVRRTRQKLSK